MTRPAALPLLMTAALVAPAAARAGIDEIASASDSLFTAPESADSRQRDYATLKAAMRQNPDAYELLWRGARAGWAIADRLDEDKDRDELTQLGEEAMRWSGHARELKPDGLEGHFWHGLAISVYARGISILSALVQGLSGQYEADMNFIITKDPAWGGGAAQRALGRYYFRLPRIKRDLARSETLLRQALEYDPKRLRTHLYMADTFAAQGKVAEARAEYRRVLDTPPGPNDMNEVETLRANAQRGLNALERR